MGWRRQDLSFQLCSQWVLHEVQVPAPVQPPPQPAAPRQDARQKNLPSKGHKSPAPHPLALHPCLLPFLRLSSSPALKNGLFRTQDANQVYSLFLLFFLSYFFFFTVNVPFVYGKETKMAGSKEEKNTSVTPTKARSLQTFPVSAWAQAKYLLH